MSEPSKELPASQLWAALTAAERPTKLVDFPRRGEDGEPVGQLLIRILTQEEQMAAAASAEKFAQEALKNSKKEDFGYERLYADEVCVQVLFRACRDQDNPKNPAFPAPKALRQVLTADECSKLFEHYLTVQLELGPIVSGMSDEELEAWIDRLVEGGSAFPFNLMSVELQQLLVLHMAFRLRTSATDNTFAGSPQDSEVSTTSSSENSEIPPDLLPE